MSTSIPSLPAEPTYTPSLTLFGSTGGCLLSTLQQLLLNPPPSHLPPQQITLLVRSQAKLTSLLTSAPYSVPSDLLTQPRLRIIEGDILTSPAETILSTITTTTQGETPRVSDVILFAIGGYPKATLTPPFFDLENPDICRAAMERVLDAVRTAKTTHESSPQGQFKKPVILAVSSTGLYKSPEPRDLPIPLLPLYKILLRGPHRDKIAMEDLLTSSSSSSDPTSALCDSIVIRGALFNSNPPSDPTKPGFVKAGYAGRKSGSANAEGLRWGDVSGPAIGWGISRADLGRWIWEEVASGRVGWTSEGVYTSEWAGKKVSLTN